ncbi:hypothetical protein VTH82DRAFT_759 [Thermothelomyces myriococcoides]
MKLLSPSAKSFCLAPLTLHLFSHSGFQFATARVDIPREVAAGRTLRKADPPPGSPQTGPGVGTTLKDPTSINLQELDRVDMLPTVRHAQHW